MSKSKKKHKQAKKPNLLRKPVEIDVEALAKPIFGGTTWRYNSKASKEE